MKINLLTKKAAAAGMSLCMLGCITINIPEFRNVSIVANAEDSCYSFDSATGQLTLRGNVVRDEICNFAEKNSVKSVTAEPGTVFPELCSNMFKSYSNCESIDLSNVDTSKVRKMKNTFEFCSSLTSVNLSGIDTSKLTTMYYAFAMCSSLTTVDLSGLDTSSLKDISFMFKECTKLESIDLSGLDLSSLETMAYMFHGCTSLKSVDLTGLNTSALRDMNCTFENCSSLTSLDMSSMDFSSYRGGMNCFRGCDNLTMLSLGDTLKEITLSNRLPNGNGWANKNEPSIIISGSDTYAEFTNTGINTYIRENTSASSSTSTTTEKPATTIIVLTTTTKLTETVHALGDVTGDDIIDGRDATDILTDYAKSSTGQESKYTDDQRKAADVNNDGIIDGRDATAILTYYAKTSTGYNDTLPEYIESIKMES